MKVKKIKKSTTDFSKYATYCFRLKPEERDDLNRRLRIAKVKLNKAKKDDEQIIKLNEIILEAIKLGLPLVKRES